MKRVLALPIALLSAALLLSACGFSMIRGSGKVVEENRPVSGFDSIASSGSGDVIITQGDTESLKVEAEDNLIKYIRTEVRGKTLHIYLDPAGAMVIQPTKPMKFYVSLKEMTGVDLSGSGTVSSDKIETGDLAVDVSGSGIVTINDLKADSVSIDISGSGQTVLKGEAATQKLEISGSGRCSNIMLVTRDTSMDISGSGGASVNASDTLNVNVSGSGNVEYTGTPKVTQNVTGSGRISSK
jgi:predicted small secreted protein